MLDVVLPDGESSEIPDMDAPESIKEVDTAQEAVKTFDDLWMNLRYQHREKYKQYVELQASLGAMNFDQPETRVDFTKMNEMRDDIVKLEGGLETLNLYRTLVLGVEPEPWLEIEIQEKRKKIKVRTNSQYSKKGGDYSKYANWEADATATDGEVNTAS
jgi:hypothetical protein|tara:strand:+ start:546 stop:1022 length:477 start_codon:yes stop_codon:yes gene_type:complete